MTTINRCIIACFDALGQVDPRFNKGTGLTIGTGLGFMRGLTLRQTADLITVAGLQTDDPPPSGWTTKSNFFALQMNLFGVLIPNFGNQGVAVRPLPDADLALFDYLGSSIGGDGTVSLGGRARTNPMTNQGPNQIAIARLTDRGAFDHTFGNGGAVTEPENKCSGLALLPGGSLLTTITKATASSALNMLLCDPAADGMRRIQTDFALDAALVPQLLSVYDGKVYVTGNATYGTPRATGYFIARMNPDGQADTAFGINGIVTSKFNGRPVLLKAMCVTAAGIHLAGAAPGTSNYLAVARHTLLGAPDTSFSGDGKRVVTYDYLAQMSVNAMVATSNGEVVVAGSANRKIFLAAFRANGDTEIHFGENNDPLEPGTVLYNNFDRPDNANPSAFTAQDIALCLNGNLVIAGTSSQIVP